MRGRPSAIALGLGLVVIATAIHLPTLNQPLLETQSFRQTHTAYTALVFYEQGIDLFRPQLPVFGPPFILPIEFPIFQALASLVMRLGVPPDEAMRATALVCFLATGLLLWRLLTRVGGKAAGLIGLAAFLFSPLGLLVSRMSLIEYLVTAAAVGFVVATLEWHDRRRMRWFVTALVAGSLAMLVKPTTAFIYFVPVLALGYSAWRTGEHPGSSRARYGAEFAILFAVPAVLGGAWTLYADGVRASNPSTAWFTAAGGLSEWYFGTLAQKLDPSTWFGLKDRADELLLGNATWLWALLALAAAFAFQRRLFLLALVLSGSLGPLVFTNQYVVPGQEYYMAAISPFAAVVIGLGSAWLLEQRSGALGLVVRTSLLIGWVVTLHLTQGYWGRQFAGVHDLDQILPAADFVVAHSEPDELVALSGQDWNPAVFYYARREGFMVRGSVEPDDLAALRAQGYRELFYCPPGRGLPEPCDIQVISP